MGLPGGATHQLLQPLGHEVERCSQDVMINTDVLAAERLACHQHRSLATGPLTVHLDQSDQLMLEKQLQQGEHVATPTTTSQMISGPGARAGVRLACDSDRSIAGASGEPGSLTPAWDSPPSWPLIVFPS